MIKFKLIQDQKSSKTVTITMTEEEKAIEIVNLMKEQIPPTGMDNTKHAIACGIILVSQILQLGVLLGGWAPGLEHMPITPRQKPYWEKVQTILKTSYENT